jgi:hypothetical protein
MALLLPACGDRSRPETAAAGSESVDGAAECTILTAADIRSITGTTVVAVSRESTPRAGGTCGNYTTQSGILYLGVNRLSSPSEYTSSVNAVPADLYPDRRPLTGIGDEAVMFRGPGLRYLVARQGGTGVVLFPLVNAAQLSDEHLVALAQRALAK